MPLRVPLQFANASMRLAQPITDPNGGVVAGVGTHLGDRVKKLLRTMAVQTVVVQDSAEVPAWERVRPADDEIAELRRRFEREPASARLVLLEEAIGRYLRRRAEALGGGPAA